MVDSIRIKEIHACLETIKEIHACLGAEEFSYYTDDNGNSQPFYMNVARRLDWLAKAYGVAFNPDGSIISARQRVSIPLNGQGSYTIPDGWARGQFADNFGGNQSPDTGQVGGLETEERLGVVYQQRSNTYENFNENNPESNTFRQGDLIMCENYLQLFESFLEDLDKGINWQEMGCSVMPSADGNSFCNINGMGNLIAEIAYMISALSKNIQLTHNLSREVSNNTKELFKALGTPTNIKALEVSSGTENSLGDEEKVFQLFASVPDDVFSIHQRLTNIEQNLAILLGSNQ